MPSGANTKQILVEKRPFIPIIQMSKLASKSPNITHTFLWFQTPIKCILWCYEMPKPGLAEELKKSGFPIWHVYITTANQALVCISSESF